MSVSLAPAPVGFHTFEPNEWPVTYTWTVVGPWGMSQQELTVNVNVLRGQDEATGELGRLLWARLVASATCLTTICTTTTYQTWRTGGGAAVALGEPMPGSLIGAPGAREDSACLMLHSGIYDRWAMRPLFLPGWPRRLTSDGLVTDVGCRALEQLAHKMVMGLMAHHVGGPMALYNRYELHSEPDSNQPRGTHFRRVDYIRVLRHLTRAPDYRPVF